MNNWITTLTISKVYLFFILIVYFCTLRAGSFEIPILNRTATSLSDGLWRAIFPGQYLKFHSFSERYGSPYEGYVSKDQCSFSAIIADQRDAKFSIPYLGEPLEVPAMLRRRHDIFSVSLSEKIFKNAELYQRIAEGVYPIRIVPQGKSNFRLVAISEIDNDKSCKLLDQCREAAVVVCR